jgi:Domain of unknown function (DUF6362)
MQTPAPGSSCARDDRSHGRGARLAAVAEPEERRLVWLRAEGLPWKRITGRLGIGRTTAWQRWTIALLKISVRLNAADEQKRPNNNILNTQAGSVLEAT